MNINEVESLLKKLGYDVIPTPDFERIAKGDLVDITQDGSTYYLSSRDAQALIKVSTHLHPLDLKQYRSSTSRFDFEQSL